MKIKSILLAAALSAFTFGSAVTLTGCEKKEPAPPKPPAAPTMQDKVDDAAKDAGDAVKEGVEKTGEAVEDAGEAIQDAAK